MVNKELSNVIRKKKNDIAVKQKILGIGILVAGVCFALILGTSTEKRQEYCVFANEDGELYIATDLGSKKGQLKLSDDFLSEQIEENDVVLSFNGRYVAFLEKERSSSQNTLYLWDSQKPRRQAREIDEDVAIVKVLDNGKILYTQEINERGVEEKDSDVMTEVTPEYRLKYFDGIESYSLDRGEITNLIINDQQTAAYYLIEYEKNYRKRMDLYKVNLTENFAVKCLENGIVNDLDNKEVEENIFELLRQDVMVYVKDDDSTKGIYAILPGKKPERLVEQADHVSMISWDGEQVSFYYTVEESAKELRKERVRFYDFVDDPYVEEDEIILNSWNPSDMASVWDGTWNEKYEKWNQASNRNKIRNDLKKGGYSIIYKNYFCYHNGRTIQIGEGPLEELFVTQPDQKFLFYSEAYQEIPKIASINEITSKGDLKIGKALKAMASPIKVVFNGIQIENELDTNGNTIIYPPYPHTVGENGVIFEMEKGGELKLEYFLVENDKFVWKDTLKQDVGKDIYSFPDGRGVYFYSDIKYKPTISEKQIPVLSGTLQYFENGVCVEIADEIDNAFFLPMYGDRFILLANELEKAGFNYEYYNLYALKNGEKAKIANNVIKFEVINDEKIICLCDDGELYLWNKKESKRIAEEVSHVWTYPFVEKCELRPIRENL